MRADLNGLFGDRFCLSHAETYRDETGAEIRLQSGMQLTAFDEDVDDKGLRTTQSMRGDEPAVLRVSRFDRR
jgi:hypothetical protein